MDKTRLVLKTLSAIFHKTRSYSRGFLMPRPLLGDTNCILYLPAWLSRPRCKSCIAPHTGIYIYIHYTRVWAWVTEYMQVSTLFNTMLCLNNRYLHIFSHPPPYPSIFPSSLLYIYISYCSGTQTCSSSMSILYVLYLYIHPTLPTQCVYTLPIYIYQPEPGVSYRYSGEGELGSCWPTQPFFFWRLTQW